MKSTVLFLAGAVMFASASNAAAQDPREGAERKVYTVPCNWTGDSGKLVKAYGKCLKSDNPGVLESALGHILWMRVAVACVDITPLKPMVDDLAVSGNSASIRLRAYLTAMVMENPEAFKELAGHEFQGPHDLFANVAELVYASEIGDYPPVAAGR
jgi:hypothetical protein